MEGMELVSFEIISAVGAARSQYLAAIQEAKKGNSDKAREMIEEGNDMFLNGHQAHAGILQKYASGEQMQIDLILMHAEDQLMSAETIRLIAEEFIELYECVIPHN